MRQCDSASILTAIGEERSESEKWGGCGYMKEGRNDGNADLTTTNFILVSHIERNLVLEIPLLLKGGKTHTALSCH